MSFNGGFKVTKLNSLYAKGHLSSCVYSLTHATPCMLHVSEHKDSFPTFVFSSERLHLIGSCPGQGASRFFSSFR